MTTKSEFLNQLVRDNGLDPKEDIFEMPLGGKKVAIITRTGIEKIQYNNNIEVKFNAEVLKEDFAVMKATAQKSDTVALAIETSLYTFCNVFLPHCAVSPTSLMNCFS